MKTEKCSTAVVLKLGSGPLGLPFKEQCPQVKRFYSPSVLLPSTSSQKQSRWVILILSDRGVASYIGHVSRAGGVSGAASRRYG